MDVSESIEVQLVSSPREAIVTVLEDPDAQTLEMVFSEDDYYSSPRSKIFVETRTVDNVEELGICDDIESFSSSESEAEEEEVIRSSPAGNTIRMEEVVEDTREEEVTMNANDETPDQRDSHTLPTSSSRSLRVSPVGTCDHGGFEIQPDGTMLVVLDSKGNKQSQSPHKEQNDTKISKKMDLSVVVPVPQEATSPNKEQMIETDDRSSISIGSTESLLDGITPKEDLDEKEGQQNTLQKFLAGFFDFIEIQDTEFDDIDMKPKSLSRSDKYAGPLNESKSSGNDDLLSDGSSHTERDDESLSVDIVITPKSELLTNDYELVTIHTACELGNRRLVKKVLLHDPRAVLKKKNGKPPLYYACKHGKSDIVRLLLAAGAKDSNMRCLNVCSTDEVRKLMAFHNYKSAKKSGDVTTAQLKDLLKSILNSYGVPPSETCDDKKYLDHTEFHESKYTEKKKRIRGTALTKRVGASLRNMNTFRSNRSFQKIDTPKESASPKKKKGATKRLPTDNRDDLSSVSSSFSIDNNKEAIPAKSLVGLAKGILLSFKDDLGPQQSEFVSNLKVAIQSQKHDDGLVSDDVVSLARNVYYSVSNMEERSEVATHWMQERDGPSPVYGRP